MEQKPNQGQSHEINIELGEKEAEGIYSNLAIISHSNAEFVIDFTRILPGVPKAKVFSRIIMSPLHTKLFLNALAENLRKYENQFGEVKLDSGQNPMGNFPGFPTGGSITN
jgi:hypothetical protein